MLMNADDGAALAEPTREQCGRGRARILAFGVATMALSLAAVEPVAAAEIGAAFCQTEMAATIKNLFTIIQYGGPLVGGVTALGATVAIPTVRRADLKKELKEVRNQGLIWGVIVAPLGTAILQFVLNDVVSGGVSCGL